jgi:TetR/AcrR family transcriptional regulator, transcriptional repressor of aconitase
VPRLSETEKEARRRHVLDGARRCFARHGYEGATVVRLEEEIGLSRGAIFNWFPSKQDLFLALAAEDNERLHSLFASGGFEALLVTIIQDDPDWLAVYFEFGRRLKADSGLRERWKEIAPPEARERSKAWIGSAQAAGELRSDVDGDDIGRFLGVIVDGIVAQRAFGFDPPDTELVLRLTSDAIGGAAGLRLKAETGTRARVRPQSETSAASSSA